MLSFIALINLPLPAEKGVIYIYKKMDSPKALIPPPPGGGTLPYITEGDVHQNCQRNP